MNGGDFGGVGHTTHRARQARSSESKSVFEIMQIDRDAGEVLLEAMIECSSERDRKKRLKTALWVKADDPRFIFWRVI